MNSTIIKEELNWLIEAINEQFETIRSYDDRIPQIEFDILMENIRKFYEDLRRLQHLHEMQLLPGQKSIAQPQPHGKPTESIVSAPETVTPAVKERSSVPVSTEAAVTPSVAPVVSLNTNPPTEPASAAPFRSGKPVEAPRKDQPVVPAPDTLTPPDPHPEKEETESTPAIRVRFDKPDPMPKEHAATPKKQSRSREMDLFASEEPTFSIKLQEAREKSLGPKVPSDRIENLKSAININEKFMFINDLFDGNLREYNETIETLNGFKSLDQANDFLDLMRRKNFWDTGSNAFKRLKELLERKF